MSMAPPRILLAVLILFGALCPPACQSKPRGGTRPRFGRKAEAERV